MASLLESYDGKDDRVSALLASGHAPRAAATFAGPMDFGMDFEDISVQDFKQAADLEPNYFTKEGFGALVARYGADVPVELSTPVRTIRWDGTGIEAVTDRGWVRAQAVIVTASPAVLAFDEIDFFPQLPDTHARAFFDLPKGTRLGLRPFDDLLIERPARHDIYFLCFPFDLDLMVGFVGGDFAWELSAAGEAAGVDFVVDRLCNIFGGDIRGAERWVRGAYAAARPGKAGAREVLKQPIDEKIFFAGEHLAGPLMQTCGGARLSGEAVALQVIGKLKAV
jgi:monoamine oxidase